jgi:hypothetical protein
VLFIGGHSRSGSTLLSRLLGQHPSTVSVGELTFIGSRGYQANQLCSCGQPFTDCRFWTDVVARVAGANPRGWFDRFELLRLHVDRMRYAPLMTLNSHLRAAPRLSNVLTHASEYSAMLGALLRAIADIAGVNVIVDSSKEPPYGFLLNRCAAVNLYPVHLVRDCRAVAFSQQRVKVRPEIHWTTEHMPRFSPAKSAVDWMLNNALMHLLGHTAGRYMRVKYEDLAIDPTAVSTQLIDWISCTDPQSPQSPSHDPVGEHELSGNPMRFKRDFRIALDVEWHDKMLRRDKIVTTAISAPLLLPYGYKISSTSPN